MSTTIYTVFCEVDSDGGSSPATWYNNCDSYETALKRAMWDIIHWVDGMWEGYPEELPVLINKGDYEAVLKIWEDCSSLSIDIQHDDIVSEVETPTVEVEEETE